MAQRRHFILAEPVLASEIGSFMCRVVASKTRPLERFAPFSLPESPPHNTNDIIPTILPEPCSSINATEFLSVTQERGMSIQLFSLLDVHLNRRKEESRTLDSPCVRRYSLPNPDRYFEELMKNELYSRDVHALLRGIWPRHAYLVTGFLTTVDSEWTIESSQATRKGFSVTLPISDAAAVPWPLSADVGASPDAASEVRQSRQSKVVGEEIFAVCYSVVKMSHRLTGSSRLFTPIPSIGRPKRAKAHHLALGNDDDEDDIEFESEEEGSARETRHRDGKMVSDDVYTIILESDSQPLSDSEGEMFIGLH